MIVHGWMKLSPPRTLDGFVRLLRSCIEDRNLDRGRLVHDWILASHQHRESLLLANQLIGMYSKCGSLQDAIDVFNRLKSPDVVSWNSLMTAFARNRQPQRALELFREMPRKDLVSWNIAIQVFLEESMVMEAEHAMDLVPQHSAVAWNSMMSTYAQTWHLQEAWHLFNHRALERDRLSWNTMLVALLASGEIEQASGVFSRMPMREILSWNAMIAAYGRIDAGAAKNIFDQALERDIIAWNTLLRVCGRFGLLDSAREAMEKMPLWDPVSCTTILAAHTQRGVLADAKKIFDAVPRNLFSWNAMLACYLQNREVGAAMGILAEMPEKDVITWNTMIAGLAANGHLADAKAIFESMASRDATSWGSIVAALAEDESSIEEALAAYRRMPQHDLCSWNALIAKDIAAARGIFDGAKERNVVTWTSLIVATCRVADGIGGAEDILERMPAWDVVCLNVMIGAHSQCGNFERAKEIFDGLPERSLHSWNAMLQIASAMEEEQGDCYCEGTREIFFYRMPARDVVSWTILLAAFAQQSLLAEAKRAFDLAPQRSLITWNVMLGIYASASAIDPAKEIFQSMPERDIVSQNSIVAAFALSGQIDESLQFLERMPQHNAGSWNSLLLGCAHHGVLDRSKQFFARVPNKNIVSWNALLDACARNGQGELAIEMLRELCLDGSSLPDGISFTHVLAACTHVGSLEISRSFFVSLAQDYGLIADKEHCCSMVDVLCRSGQLGFAEELINSVPLLGSDNVALGSLLAACHTHHDLERAYRALPRDHTSSSHYVILSNILTSI